MVKIVAPQELSTLQQLRGIANDLSVSLFGLPYGRVNDLYRTPLSPAFREIVVVLPKSLRFDNVPSLPQEEAKIFRDIRLMHFRAVREEYMVSLQIQ